MPEVIELPNTDPEVAQLWDDFHAVVNMPAPDLRNWLGVAPREADGYLYEPDTDVRTLGPKVLAVLSRRVVDLTDADTEVMRQVVDAVRAWLGSPRDEGPDADRWRHSLMSLGHDPLKADSPHGTDAEVLRQ